MASASASAPLTPTRALHTINAERRLRARRTHAASSSAPSGPMRGAEPVICGPIMASVRSSGWTLSTSRTSSVTVSSFSSVELSRSSDKRCRARSGRSHHGVGATSCGALGRV